MLVDEHLSAKIEMLRRNDPVIKSVESVLRPGRESMVWERFVKEVGLEPGVKQRPVMDGESGELTGS